MSPFMPMPALSKILVFPFLPSFTPLLPSFTPLYPSFFTLLNSFTLFLLSRAFFTTGFFKNWTLLHPLHYFGTPYSFCLYYYAKIPGHTIKYSATKIFLETAIFFDLFISPFFCSTFFYRDHFLLLFYAFTSVCHFPPFLIIYDSLSQFHMLFLFLFFFVPFLTLLVFLFFPPSLPLLSHPSFRGPLLCLSPRRSMVEWKLERVQLP